MDGFFADICMGFVLWNVKSVHSLSRRVFCRLKFFNFSLNVIPKKEGGDRSLFVYQRSGRFHPCEVGWQPFYGIETTYKLH